MADLTLIKNKRGPLNDKEIDSNFELIMSKADSNHTHQNASQESSGFLSYFDKVKLDGIEMNANFYIHPILDGSRHIPPNGTVNGGKILKSGSTAGDVFWDSISYNEIESHPTKLSDFENDIGFITESFHDTTKQDILISGDSIKTLNNESLLGSGNIAFPEQFSYYEIVQTLPTADLSWLKRTVYVIDTASEYVCVANSLEPKDSDCFWLAR